MKLIYTPKQGFECPGEGWPAADHEEGDADVAEAKIASGFFYGGTPKEYRAAIRRADAETAAVIEAAKQEAVRQEAASKKAANEKAQLARDNEIAAADKEAVVAKETASETRKRLGREE